MTMCIMCGLKIETWINKKFCSWDIRFGTLILNTEDVIINSIKAVSYDTAALR